MKKIVFTEKAELNFEILISNIEARFGAAVALRILNEVRRTVDHISVFPELGKVYRDDIRFLVVRSKTILIYRVAIDCIIILDFFDSRQDWLDLL